jgi:hypothetical protein
MRLGIKKEAPMNEPCERQHNRQGRTIERTHASGSQTDKDEPTERTHASGSQTDKEEPMNEPMRAAAMKTRKSQ